MRHPPAYIAIVALLSACDTDEGPCEERSGSYIVRMTETEGNCGEAPTAVANADLPPTTDPNCEQTTLVSDDECEITTLIECAEPSVGPDVTSKMRTVIRWAHDGESADGVATISITTPDSVLCHSSYDVTVDRAL